MITTVLFFLIKPPSKPTTLTNSVGKITYSIVKNEIASIKFSITQLHPCLYQHGCKKKGLWTNDPNHL